jgi:arylacetamide deacetylase-like 3/4
MVYSFYFYNNSFLFYKNIGGNIAVSLSSHLIEQNITKPKLQVLIYPMLQFFDFSLPSYRINLPKRVLGVIDHDNFKDFIEHFTGFKVDDSLFMNGHTSSEQKEEYSKFVNTDYLPYHLKKHSLNKITQLNSTIRKGSELTKILLNKEVSPLLVDDDYLFNHTPINTFLLTTEMDILRDDGFIYADRLRRIGKNIEHKHYENLFHGIISLIHGPLEFKYAQKLVKDISDHINSVIYS